MMLRRIRKQITYGVGFLLIIGAMLGSFAWVNHKAALQQAAQVTPTPIFLPIKLEHTYIIRHDGIAGADTVVDVVGQLRNPNPAAGVDSLDITILLRDTGGQEITRVVKNSYLLPGSLQYVMAFSIPLQHRVLGQVEVEFEKEPMFVALPPSVNLPQFSAFAKERLEKTIGANVIEEEHGIVKNTSTFDWGKVEVFVVGVGSTGEVVSAGQTFVGALTVGEEREFIVTWPKPSTAIDRLIILPSTNMYSEENLLRSAGNPTLLH